jgi:hypothetical protein
MMEQKPGQRSAARRRIHAHNVFSPIGANMTEKTKHQPGQPDYGHNNPTGGTKENTGKLNPQGPTSGTENSRPDSRREKQSAA